jgi:hypothetical protein
LASKLAASQLRKTDDSQKRRHDTLTLLDRNWIAIAYILSLYTEGYHEAHDSTRNSGPAQYPYRKKQSFQPARQLLLLDDRPKRFKQRNPGRKT